jgi:hypothetical protein
MEGSPIDFFYACLSKDSLISNYRDEAKHLGGSISEFESKVDKAIEFVKSTVEKMSDELPHTIKFITIPRYGFCDTEICMLAKISNNGTTYLFTDNKDFAEFISENSGYGFRVRKI